MMPLLQLAPNTFWRQDKASDMTTMLIWIGGAILLIVLVAVIRNGGFNSGSSGSYSKRGFRRSARGFGFAEDEVRFLDGYARTLGIGNPAATFGNKAKLETFFRDVYRTIEKNSDSESDAEDRKATLFAIRERVARNATVGTPVNSTRQLGKNTPLTFITPAEENYPSVVVRSESTGLAVEPVIDPYGEVIRFKRGTKLSCFFYTKAHQGYQFTTRVSGFQDFGGRELMVLSHNDAIAALPSRQFQRRSARVPCVFYRVAVTTVKTRGKQTASARVETISFPGIVVDLSAGGMGIQSANPLAVGDFAKVMLDPGGGKQMAFGKVIRVNKLKGSGGMMHIQFVKISRKSLNAILSYVFGYVEY
ncbi:MAG: PilZ domain-containing protein [Spirochaetota bacterium]